MLLPIFTNKRGFATLLVEVLWPGMDLAKDQGGAGRSGGGRGRSYSGNKGLTTRKVGPCKDLEANIFD